MGSYGGSSTGTYTSPKVERRKSFNRNASFTYTPPAAGDVSSSANTVAVEEQVDYFGSISLQDRIRQYAVEGGIPLDFVEKYTSEQSAGRGKVQPVPPTDAFRR